MLVAPGLEEQKNVATALAGRSTEPPVRKTELFAAPPVQLTVSPWLRVTAANWSRFVQVRGGGTLTETLKAGPSEPPAPAKAKLPGLRKSLPANCATAGTLAPRVTWVNPPRGAWSEAVEPSPLIDRAPGLRPRPVGSIPGRIRSDWPGT